MLILIYPDEESKLRLNMRLNVVDECYVIDRYHGQTQNDIINSLRLVWLLLT